MSFPRYPAYKDSGVEWLGEVPEHWEVLQLKRLARRPISNGIGAPSDTDDPYFPRYIRITDIKGRTELREDTFRSLPPSLAQVARVDPNDILLACVGATFGISYLHTHDIGACCYAGYLARFSHRKDVEPRFVSHWTQSKHYWSQLEANVIQSTVQNFSSGKYKALMAPVPSVDEQANIATFLDHETAKIDALIAEQQRLIELLQEKLKAVISHTVTKGLNPDAPMKDSGVEWLGDAPKSWELGPLKHFWDVVDCKHVTVPFLDDGYPVASIMEVRGFDLDLSQVQRTSTNYFHLLTEGGRQPSRGDVIYCRNTANTGMSAYVNTDQPIAIGQDVVLIKSQTQNGRFLNYILHSGIMAAQLDTLLVGSTFKRINVAQIRSLSVTCPPKEEQDAIVDFLDSYSATYSALSADARRAISLLNERRTALISAAVTGQIDVRGLAPVEGVP